MDGHDRTDVSAHDADAPWRPGYTGPEPRPDWPAPAAGPALAATPSTAAPDPWSRDGADRVDAPSEGVPPGSVGGSVETSADGSDVPEVADDERPTHLIAAIAAAVVALVAVGVVVVSSRGGDDRSISIPADVDELWSIEVDPTAGIEVAQGVVVVSEFGVVRGLDGRSGEPLWTVDVLDGGSPDTVFTNLEVSHSDGLVMVHARPPGPAGRSRALDARSGDERWARDVADGTNIFLLEDHLVEYTIDPSTDRSGPPELRLLDAATGDPVSDSFELFALSGDVSLVSIVDPDDADRLALVDLDTGEIVAGGIDRAGLRSVSMIAGEVVVATEDGSLVLLGEDGETLDEIAVDVGPADAGRLLLPIGGTDVGLLSGVESVLAFRIDDDEIEVAWGMTGEPVFARNPGDEPLLTVAGAQPNETWLRMVDPRSGDVAFEVDGDTNQEFWFGDPVLAADGVVYADPSAVRALDLEGNEMWSIDGDVNRLLVDDGVVITLERGRLTAYG